LRVGDPPETDSCRGSSESCGSGDAELREKVPSRGCVWRHVGLRVRRVESRIQFCRRV